MNVPSREEQETLTEAEQSRAAKGIPKDGGELFRLYSVSVTKWARKLAGPTIDHEDVVQEVFLTAHRLLPTFRGDAQITTWLYRITENVVRHRRRKDRFRRWLGGSSDDVAGNTANTDLSAHDRIEERQAVQLVYRALDGMKEKYRTVIILYEFEKMSGEELAEKMGCSHETVRVWLYRARAQFEERVKKLQAKEKGE